MIKEGQVVSLAYTLTDESGVVLDTADKSAPFSYLHGANQMIPGLEKALEGRKSGDVTQVTVQPEDAYGIVNPALNMVIPRDRFPAGNIQAGMQFSAPTPDGQSAVFTVVAASDESVTVDGNHPLAGKVLNFDVEVLEVREASAEETEHGHVHGPDGHSH